MKKNTVTALLLAAVCLPGFSNTVCAEEKTFTLDADFMEGTLLNLHHDPQSGQPLSAHDQLQLNNYAKPFRFINIPASARGTVVRVDTDTGEIVGEYKTAPKDRGLDPSRTTVDIYGNVWTGNREEKEGDSDGAATKIGIVIDGTRCNRDRSPNPDGDYVWLDPAKLTYNTCVDRDGDGLIRTSKGLGNILSWEDKGDGAGGANGGDARVQDAEDECILLYQRLPNAPRTRHVSVDRENNVWVAGYPDEPTMFHKLNGETGAIVESFDAAAIGCGGYGGTIVNNNFDQIIGNDVLWSASRAQDMLLRYDLSTNTGMCIDITSSYGIGIDNDGFIWNSMSTEDLITKINPNTGVQVPGFPVPAGGEHGKGIAVTADNTIWSANSDSNTVTRLDSDGNLLATINVGTTPKGLSVDKAGKVWVTNRDSNNAMRINPATNAIDLTVDLGAEAGPYNYSDMTGIVRLSHPPIGFWDVVYDTQDCTLWDKISWNSIEDSKSDIVVEVRTAADKAGLAGVPFTPVAAVITGDYHEADLVDMKGRFVEVRATLTTEAPVGERNLPILQDLTLKHYPLDIKVTIPDQKYSFGFPPIDLDDYITFKPAGDYYDDVIWSHSPVPAGWSVTIDDNHVATVTCPEDETEDVNIIFSAKLSWGMDMCAAESNPVLFEANHPPELCDLEAFQCIPKNNKKMFPVPLTGFVCDEDGDPVTVEILSITSDEPTAKNAKDKDKWDANPDCIGTDTAWVRQERDAHGDGRVYEVTFIAKDGRGGETIITLPLQVPHDGKGDCAAVDSGQLYDATKKVMK